VEPYSTLTGIEMSDKYNTGQERVSLHDSEDSDLSDKSEWEQVSAKDSSRRFTYLFFLPRRPSTTDTRLWNWNNGLGDLERSH